MMSKHGVLPKKGRTGKFICDVCSKSYATKPSFNTHRSLKHPETTTKRKRRADKIQ